ncbi:MAG: DNA alkylation repair protein [Candidatus Hodarchaeota archaeon]
MSNIEAVVKDIRNLLKDRAPPHTEDQMSRMYKIINPDIPNYEMYGLRTSEVEKIVKTVFNSYDCNYEDAVEIFKVLIRSNSEDEKFAAFFFLNRFKKFFNEDTIKLFKKEYSKYCNTWSVCDSTCIRVIGPFLGKKGNEELAIKVIDEWSSSNVMWIKRASIVILLKLVMIRRDFDNSCLFNFVEKMLKFADQNYIEKGIGWLLKTCSKYNPDLIYNYLMKNKDKLTRLILRYASEKLPKEKRSAILRK